MRVGRAGTLSALMAAPDGALSRRGLKPIAVFASLVTKHHIGHNSGKLEGTMVLRDLPEYSGADEYLIYLAAKFTDAIAFSHSSCSFP